MKKEAKDTLAVVSACLMLVFGITLTAIGFALDPVGEIHDSVLWVLGQSLIYAGSIFGIAYYARGIVDRRMDAWERKAIDKANEACECEEPEKEEVER